MRAPKLHQPWFLGNALFWVVLAVVELARGSGDSSDAVPWLIAGALWGLAAFRRPRPQAGRGDGPDPLRATPTGRFRTTGWPPSKDPADYR